MILPKLDGNPIKANCMAFSGPQEDQASIRTLHDVYADAVFRRDADTWSSCWVEDSYWNLAGLEVKGRASIKNLWLQAMNGFSFVAFFSQVGSIQIQGDSASGSVYTNEILVDNQGAVSRSIGAYSDEYIRLDGNWRYSSRRFVVLRSLQP